MRKSLFLLILFLFFAPIQPASANKVAFLKGKVVVVDAGHGGCDPGAIYKDIYEKHINLQIAIKLKEVLEQTGVKVILTRHGDYHLVKESQRRDLGKRVELANSSKASLFVSIHVNTHHSASRSGAEVFYYPKSEKNKLLAECILGQLQSIHSTSPERTVKTSDYYVLRNTGIPAAMVEVGFLSNPEDRKRLLSGDYQLLLARRISCGILKYLIVESSSSNKTPRAKK
ncbi:MAG: N-acetylmuramoyl-L-alanine amidase family protein [Bacillota bacterium]